MKIWNRFGLLAAAVTAASGMSVSVALAEPETLLKFGHAASTSTPAHVALEKVDALIRENTDGRVGLELFPNSQLGGERELIESIQLGNIDMAFVSTAPLAAFDSDFYVFDMPFLFTDHAAVYSVLDGPIGQEMLDGLQRVGIMGVSYWENGFRQFENASRVVKTADDLKGLKMRTMENEVHIAAWREAGANPAPLAFGELFTALQQGTFDAMEGPINLFYSMKFNEVQKNISLTNHIYSPLVIMMNPDSASMLSDEDLAALKAAFAEIAPLQREMTQQADKDAIAAMPSVAVTELSPEDLATFSEKMGPVYDLVKQKVGGDLVDRIVATVK
ncbi:TRAP transporter substrate-binding protein [Salipiger sp. P9]|uniref:TRAP transporter substrate-binding protein n=1 Tax=Salipiger pentaromativorans TaxID=2943193 RepID=UPI0021570311|nr:TRAP transporter substrate-binding protein [Salipiger pentaromativorans]MCR8551043.1 TRAP transporter substrate-binding protein [Salipiger pentaromativorans]